MKIYVASSWRNKHQADVVIELRKLGHQVYDFRNPGPGQRPFSWSEIDPLWQEWGPGEFIKKLNHPVAAGGFTNDAAALWGCDVCVLVMPAGRSACLEAGWAAGAGKKVYILQLNSMEPELMFKLATRVFHIWEDLVRELQRLAYFNGDHQALDRIAELLGTGDGA